MQEELRVERRFWGPGDIELEENWLNEMAAQGWALVSVDGNWGRKYAFERSDPGEYIVRMRVLRWKTEEWRIETGKQIAEQADGEFLSLHGDHIYCRRLAEKGQFELFADNAERIKYMNWLLRGHIIDLLEVVLCVGYLVLGLLKPVDPWQLALAALWGILSFFSLRIWLRLWKLRKKYINAEK